MSENLKSALKSPGVIDQKLEDDLAVTEVEPTFFFISSLLGLVSKSNGSLRKIHHLSHFPSQSVNDNISVEVSELRYAKFSEIFNLVIHAGRNCIILKRDIKDAFKTILVALYYQWLLGFMWKNRYYKETYLSFGLATARFLFNFFAKSLH